MYPMGYTGGMVEIQDTHEFSRWFDQLKDIQEQMAAYLEAAFEDGDPQVVATALGNIARAKGIAQIARDAGLSQESLYKALSPGGNPEMATFLKVVRALGIHLHATAAL
jgi:probable addiction module antidote protein